MWQMPYAFYHDDTPDFLTTPDRLLFDHKLELHAKKTFLVPTVFTVPFVLHIPALIAIPVFQHAVGLGLVVVVGLLCRLWFRSWKIFIVPLTILTAANPFLLWYEHTLMAETIYVFCTALVALAGTLYVLERSIRRFVFLAVALVLEAGARPEGKLLFGFGIFVLVLLHAREWRTMWPRVAAMLVLGITMHFLTKTSQAGLLLYTSVVRLTPTDLKIAPGFDPYVAPIRESLQQRWAEHPQFPKVRDRRAVAEAVGRYLKENDAQRNSGHRSVNEFCLKLASETCRRNISQLPELAYHKFRAVASESPSGLLDNDWLFGKQRDALADDSGRTTRLAKLLTGQPISDVAGMNNFVDQHFGEVTWYNRLNGRWLEVVNRLRMPDQTYTESAGVFVYRGIPLYFIAAGIGVIAMMLRRGSLQLFHVAWGLTMLGFFFVIMLTANVRPRFRIVFEPFWFIYIALLAETLWLTVTLPFRKA
jgi:hypothetical protein